MSFLSKQSENKEYSSVQYKRLVIRLHASPKTTGRLFSITLTAAMQIYCNTKILYTRKSSTPQDWSETSTLPLFNCRFPCTTLTPLFWCVLVILHLFCSQDLGHCVCPLSNVSLGQLERLGLGFFRVYFSARIYAISVSIIKKKLENSVGRPFNVSTMFPGSLM